MKLDRKRTYKGVLTRLAAKINSRLNVIKNLGETTWGVSAGTLKTSILGLVLLVPEYFLPVWTAAMHISGFDTQLNRAIKIISGVLKPSNINWLLRTLKHSTT